MFLLLYGRVRDRVLYNLFLINVMVSETNIDFAESVSYQISGTIKIFFGIKLASHVMASISQRKYVLDLLSET